MIRNFSTYDWYDRISFISLEIDMTITFFHINSLSSALQHRHLIREYSITYAWFSRNIRNRFEDIEISIGNQVIIINVLLFSSLPWLHTQCVNSHGECVVRQEHLLQRSIHYYKSELVFADASSSLWVLLYSYAENYHHIVVIGRPSCCD